MPLFACLLLFTVFRNVNALDGTFQVPANEWRYLDSQEWRYPTPGMKDSPAIIRAAYTVESGPPVRMLLVDRGTLDSLKRGESRNAMHGAAATSGRLQQRIGAPGDYVIVLDNHGSTDTAIVHMHVTLDSWDTTQLSPERKLAVLAISFAVFFGLVSFSAVKLWRASQS
jgi:hypothetical protein